MSHRSGIVQPDGLHIGPVFLHPETGTDGHLDTPADRERERRGEEDARAAQRRPAPAPPAVPLLPFGDGGEVDEEIEGAHARLAGEQPAPILLHDPVTGAVVEEDLDE